MALAALAHVRRAITRLWLGQPRSPARLPMTGPGSSWESGYVGPSEGAPWTSAEPLADPMQRGVHPFEDPERRTPSRRHREDRRTGARAPAVAGALAPRALRPRSGLGGGAGRAEHQRVQHPYSAPATVRGGGTAVVRQPPPGGVRGTHVWLPGSAASVGPGHCPSTRRSAYSSACRGRRCAGTSTTSTGGSIAATWSSTRGCGRRRRLPRSACRWWAMSARRHVPRGPGCRSTSMPTLCVERVAVLCRGDAHEAFTLGFAGIRSCLGRHGGQGTAPGDQPARIWRRAAPTGSATSCSWGPAAPGKTTLVETLLASAGADPARRARCARAPRCATSRTPSTPTSARSRWRSRRWCTTASRST